MEEKIYFIVKIACAIFILWHLWIFIFNRQMYGIWNKIYRLMRIVRIRLWKYRKKRMKQKAHNARKKQDVRNRWQNQIRHQTTYRQFLMLLMM